MWLQLHRLAGSVADRNVRHPVSHPLSPAGGGGKLLFMHWSIPSAEVLPGRSVLLQIHLQLLSSPTPLSSEWDSPKPSFIIFFLLASVLLVESTLLKALETADQAPEAALVRDAPQQCFLLHSCCYPASSSTTVAPSVKAATVILEVSRSLFCRGVWSF